MCDQRIVEQFNDVREEIKTDGYSMSIGELINLYEDEDLVLAPAFQRQFRWNKMKMSLFIESLLMGIPVPSIFVAQDLEGKWTVVDGVQRISTILFFAGKLKFESMVSVNNDESGDVESDYEEYQQTENLASNCEDGNQTFSLKDLEKLNLLNEKKWDDIPAELKRVFKRTKIDVRIILTEQNFNSMLELFYRLNTNSTALTAQEIRNSLIIMADKEFYENFNRTAQDEKFLKLLKLSKKKIQQDDHKELLIRFIVGQTLSQEELTSGERIPLFSKYIDEQLNNIFADFERKSQMYQVLNDIPKVVKLLEAVQDESGGQSPLSSYDSESKNFKGSLNFGLFEAITSGLAKNLEYWEKQQTEDLKAKIIEMNSSEKFYEDVKKRGTRAQSRFKSAIKFGENFFNENSINEL